MFETRKEMKNYLFNRVKKEKEEEELAKGIHPIIFDELTKTTITYCLYDLKKYGKEKAIELGREREKEARLAELAKAETQKHQFSTRLVEGFDFSMSITQPGLLDQF